MRYRKLSDTGDYVFGNNKQDFFTGQEAIAQAIKTKVLLFYGEWWEDLGLGIPMFQSVLGNRNKETIRTVLNTLLTKRILEVREVESVDSLEAEIVDRTINVTIKCTTNFDVQIEVGVVL